MSAGEYVVAPIPPEGPLLDEYIDQCWEALPLAQRNLPEWAPTRVVWLPILQREPDILVDVASRPRVRVTIVEDVAAEIYIARKNLLATTNKNHPRSIR
jgi:hypothetical protein